MDQEYLSFCASPVGVIAIVGTNTHIIKATFSEVLAEGRVENELTRFAAAEFSAYFAGKVQVFIFPMLQSGTPFQLDVWDRLNSIPYGTTISYAAFSAHQPLAIRAIASANGKNNIAIAVPCHRVIGSSGKLVGYAGGLWRKKWLLQHEREVFGVGQAELKF